MNNCNAEKIGLRIGNVIFLLADTKELVCKECKIDCRYKIKDYTKQDYKKAVKE